MLSYRLPVAIQKNLPVFALAAVLVIVVFYFHGGVQGIRAGKMLALVVLGSLLWSWALCSKVHWSAGYLMAAAALSVVGAGFGPAHAPVLVFVTVGTFVMWWCAEVGLKASRPILWALLFSGVLQAFYGFGQSLGLDPFFMRTTTQDQWLPVGTLGQQTLYGPFIVAACGAALFIQPLLLIVLLPAAVMTLSSMTLLSLCALGGFYVIQRWGMKVGGSVMLALAAFGALSYFVFPESFAFDDQGRFQIWASALKLWWERPLFGYGLGNYAILAPLDQSMNLAKEHGYFLQAHNDYVQVLFETGIVGFLGVLAAFIAVAQRARQTLLHPEGRAWMAVFIAIAANALGNFPFHVAPLALLGAMSWSFLVARDSESSGEQVHA